jgi:protein-tyrosine phosphatase
LNGLYNNYRKGIISACSKFNSALRENRIALEILPGAEVHLDMEILNALEDNRLMTLNDTGQFFLLELPDQFVPRALIGFVARLKGVNVTPIIAHPERNMAIQRDVTLLHDLVSEGALSQITGRSLTGEFGSPAFKCSLRIIELNLAHFLATDAHSPGNRPPTLSRAVKKLSKLIGRPGMKNIVFEKPQMLLKGHRPEGLFQEHPSYKPLFDGDEETIRMDDNLTPQAGRNNPYG